jgi:hypothetical protein
MLRSKFIFALCVLLMMCAGVVVGRLSVLVPKAGSLATQPSGRGPNWLVDQLHLTADQQHQMDAIWSDTRQKMDKAGEQRHAAEKARDQAIRNLLSDTQQSEYDKILDDFRTARAEMEKQRWQLMRDAEDKSRALLDDEQKKKWDAMNKQREGHEGHDGRGMHRPATDRSGPMQGREHDDHPM